MVKPTTVHRDYESDPSVATDASHRTEMTNSSMGAAHGPKMAENARQCWSFAILYSRFACQIRRRVTDSYYARQLEER
jgi:hypothetical protein